MPITESASRPVTAQGTGNSPLTTASFTPPAGSLLVAMVAGGWGSATVAVTDSLGGTWILKQLSNTIVGGLAAMFIRYVPTSAAMTVTATYTGLGGGRMMDIRVLQGAGSQQNTSAVQGGNSATPLGTITANVTTGVKNTFIYGVESEAGVGGTPITYGGAANTSLLSNFYNGADGVAYASFRSTIAQANPGSGTYGVTSSPNAPSSHISIMEIQPSPVKEDVTLVADTVNLNIQLTLIGMTNYDTILIERNNPDGSTTPIRQANNVANILGTDTVVFFDYECPLNVSVTYKVTGTTHNIDGTTTVNFCVTNPVMLPFTQWKIAIKSLSAPSTSMILDVEPMEDVVRPVRQQINPIIGSKYPVVISDVSQARRGTIKLRTDDLTSRTALIQLLTSGQVLFFQADSDPVSGDGWEDMFFVAGDLTEHYPARSKVTVRQWTLPFTEVASPNANLTSIPGNSWLLVTGFGTWQSVRDLRSNWLGVLNNPWTP